MGKLKFFYCLIKRINIIYDTNLKLKNKQLKQNEAVGSQHVDVKYEERSDEGLSTSDRSRKIGGKGKRVQSLFHRKNGAQIGMGGSRAYGHGNWKRRISSSLSPRKLRRRRNVPPPSSSRAPRGRTLRGKSRLSRVRKEISRFERNSQHAAERGRSPELTQLQF